MLAAFKRDLTELTAGIARIEAEAATGMQGTTSVSAADGINDIIARLGDLVRRVEVMIARAAVADGEEISAVDMSPRSDPTLIRVRLKGWKRVSRRQQPSTRR